MERAPLQVEEIRREMQHVRANLGTEVHNLARRARETVDWRYYVGSHPWICLSAVAAAGYLLVPRPKGPIVGLEGVTKEGKRLRVQPADPIASVTSAITGAAIRALTSAIVQRGMDLINGRRNGESGAAHETTKQHSVDPACRDESSSASAEPW